MRGGAKGLQLQASHGLPAESLQLRQADAEEGLTLQSGAAQGLEDAREPGARCRPVPGRPCRLLASSWQRPSVAAR